jgi:hypothetical protein
MSLRDQFKATPVSDLKKVVKEEDSKISSGGKKTDFLEIKDGLNKFRLFPKHQTEESFYHIRGVHWMTVEDDKGEDRRTTVLNSRLHGGFSKDIIEEYMRFVKESLGSGDSEDTEKIKKMVSWQDGITLQTSWICYANKMSKDKGNEFGVLEFKKTVRDGINDESIIEDEDEAITVDPFTDPDDGKPLLITYNSKAKKAADYYKVQVSKSAVMLTDDELEKFSKTTPLSELPMLKYSPEMFELALNGIQHFDSENEVDLFDTDEFQGIIEDLRENFNKTDKPKKSSKSTPEPTSKSSNKVEKKAVVVEEDEEEEDEDDETEGDEFSSMDRNTLKKHILKNKLDLKLKTSMSDEDIRNLIREYSVEDEAEDEEEEDEDTPPPSDKKKPKTLEEIKAELRKKQSK